MSCAFCTSDEIIMTVVPVSFRETENESNWQSQLIRSYWCKTILALRWGLSQRIIAFTNNLQLITMIWICTFLVALLKSTPVYDEDIWKQYSSISVFKSESRLLLADLEKNASNSHFEKIKKICKIFIYWRLC